MKCFLILLISFCPFLGFANPSNYQDNNGIISGFIENKGQIINQDNNVNTSVLYMWNGRGITAQLMSNGFSYQILKSEKGINTNQTIGKLQNNIHPEISNNTGYIQRVDIKFIGANEHPQIIAEGKSPDYFNFYTTGTPEKGINYVYYYSKVLYENIYPNIDVEFLIDNHSDKIFKYNFIIKPNGNPSDIKLEYSGADDIIMKNGGLSIITDLGKIDENIPDSYEQDTYNKIAVRYKSIGNNIYGFTVANYNKNRTLIIDPWATYFGGDNYDHGYGISSDSKGNIYVVGSTSSINIASSGAYQTVNNGNDDAYIVKFDSLGNRLWCTYYGGSNYEEGWNIAVDNKNDIVAIGSTSSTNNISSVGSYQPIFGGNVDFFILKLNKDGIRKWSTYYGDIGLDEAYTVTTDKLNNIYVAGMTASNSGVTSPGAHQTVFGSGISTSDGLLIKLDSNGNRLWATYYGGYDSLPQAFETIHSVCTDKYDNIIITGCTNATNNIASNGCFQSILGGGGLDAFLAKFNSAGVRQWGTYYGGDDIDNGWGVTVDSSNNILFTGTAASLNSIATVGTHKSTTTTPDAFLVKFSPEGTRTWGSYYGGAGLYDCGYSIAVGDSNNIILVGQTDSHNDGIATTGAYQTIYGGGNADAFMAKFDSNCVRQWGTYFGGTGLEEFTTSVHISNTGSILVTGNTTSASGIATPGAFQTAIDSVNMYDAFIASFSNSGQLTTAISGLINPAKNSLLQVYPNPAKDKITVSIKDYKGKRGSISVVDVMGRAVGTSTPLSDHSLTIDIKQWPSGVYFVQYDDGEVCETVKFVKE